MQYQAPSRRETIICLSLWAVYYLVTGLVMGLRPEHFFFSALFLALFFASSYTRKLAMCMIPFLFFAISYDVMRLYPNYMVNPIDVEGIYEAEKSLFGVTVDGQLMTLNEYFAQHNCALGDFLGGLFYLCWVPGPIAFGLYLFFSGKRALFLRFAWAFLFINLVGFVGYYVHPAAPPWYIAEYGTTPILNTPGNVAGLIRFDNLLGIDVFQGMYSRNANVFAAVPSLHSTYCLCAFLFALMGRQRWYVCLPLGILSLGICWTAVYTSHHYLIDVLLGVFLAVTFSLLWEYVILRWKPVRHFYEKYAQYVS